jgi:hypothetical protein
LPGVEESRNHRQENLSAEVAETEADAGQEIQSAEKRGHRQGFGAVETGNAAGIGELVVGIEDFGPEIGLSVGTVG